MPIGLTRSANIGKRRIADRTVFFSKTFGGSLSSSLKKAEFLKSVEDLPCSSPSVLTVWRMNGSEINSDSAAYLPIKYLILCVRRQ
jgi:hypothetical protein